MSLNARALIAVGLFVLGAVIVAVNVYISIVRQPLHRLLGREVKHVSGYPIYGSLFLWVAAAFAPSGHWVVWPALLISLFDLGGLHVFCGVMLWEYLRSNRIHE